MAHSFPNRNHSPTQKQGALIVGSVLESPGSLDHMLGSRRAERRVAGGHDGPTCCDLCGLTALLRQRLQADHRPLPAPLRRSGGAAHDAIRVARGSQRAPVVGAPRIHPTSASAFRNYTATAGPSMNGIAHNITRRGYESPSCGHINRCNLSTQQLRLFRWPDRSMVRAPVATVPNGLTKLTPITALGGLCLRHPS